MQDLSLLGPLARFVGTWEGDKGRDVAPSDDRGIEKNDYRKQMVFEPIAPVRNHEQILYGLRYKTLVHRIGDTEALHEDLGYWLWDPLDRQVIKSFVIPRGISVLAGGTVENDAKKFTISSRANMDTYGVCHNIFLEKEFKIVAFELTIEFLGDKKFSYEQNTQLRIKNKPEIFDHRDSNVLSKTSHF